MSCRRWPRKLLTEWAPRCGADRTPIRRYRGVLLIGPSHLILELASEPGAPATKAILDQGVVLDPVRRTVAATLPPPADEVPSLNPIRSACREGTGASLPRSPALGQGLGHSYVGTEDILLGLEDGWGILTGPSFN